ncbi:MAG: methyltransferase domain-containing protein, partial [Treponemataceae bacterium]|nr:methyltransferase domain-containing protein [Treponemataceae bacterium]
HQIVRLFPEPGEYALIAADCFALERDEALRFRAAAQLLAIDDGSENGTFCDYLLDILPSADAARVPNMREPAFIETPRSRKPPEERGKRKLEKILVCLGGEDPAALTVPAAEFFASEGRDVTAVLPHAADFVPPTEKKIRWIPPVKNLKETLASYDVVATHYGLTAFEAAAAGCAVVLLPTTKLHGRLAAANGFFSLDVRQKKPALSADEVLGNAERLYPPFYDRMRQEGRPLGLFVKELSHGRRFLCPVCHNDADGAADEVVMRTARRTFRRCGSCGIVYSSWTADRVPAIYGKSYFSEEYKNQYGRTYLEDFDAIKKAGMRRIGEIRSALRLREAARPSILDVGCAYGPFLAAADSCGWQAFGTDISEDAVDYVRNTLLFPAVCARFPEFNAAAEFGVNEFSAVSMWYVIEHFSDLRPVLAAVSKLLKAGGVFAFSTPSGAGISAKSDAASFFERSPADHFTIWEPSGVARIVSRFGFSVVKIVSTGHHAERFPAVRAHGWKPSSALFKLCGGISRMCRLGDTFEVYCRKVR